MEIRQKKLTTTIRTTSTSLKNASMSIRTGRKAGVISTAERREAEKLILASLGPSQKRIFKRMPERKKENYIKEVAVVMQEEQNAGVLPDTLPEKSTQTSPSGAVKERMSIRQSKSDMFNPTHEKKRGFKNVRAKRKADARTGARSDRGLKRPVKAAGSIAVASVVNRVKTEIQTEERNTFRKSFMISRFLTQGMQDAMPVLFARKGNAGGKVFLSVLKRTGSAIGTIFKPFLIFFGVLLLCVVLLVAIILPGGMQTNTVSMDGLPAMISEEMVSAAIEMRDEYNQPASVLLAQIIVESRGRYGDGLSLLAYQYHNLFGIKSFSASDDRIFMWNRAHTDGGWYRIFQTHTDCIEYRAEMLTRPRYAQYTSGIDWKTKEGAQAWAQAVKNGGWAEAPNYVSSLVEQMDKYDLYRYDTMSMNEAMTAGTVSGGTGAEVVEYACQFIGNRYVWGGESLTNGCDCSGFVMKVYEHFGVSMPHSSYAQRSVGRAVSVEDMQPGDIVCYSGHVGIYAGNGQIVNASNSKPYPAGGIKYTNAGYRTIVAVRRIF